MRLGIIIIVVHGSKAELSCSVHHDNDISCRRMKSPQTSSHSRSRSRSPQSPPRRRPQPSTAAGSPSSTATAADVSTPGNVGYITPPRSVSAATMPPQMPGRGTVGNRTTAHLTAYQDRCRQRPSTPVRQERELGSPPPIRRAQRRIFADENGNDAGRPLSPLRRLEFPETNAPLVSVEYNQL